MNLVLNFDINGTITAIDSTDDHLDLSSQVNMVVSKSIFGTINEYGEWIINDDPLDINGIAYYYFNKTRGSEFKELSYIFTEQGQPGERFRSYYKKIMNDMQSGKILFNSFLNIFNVYPNAKLVLRTFGKDGKLIVDHLKTEFGYNKPFTFAKYIRSGGKHILEFEDGTTIDNIVDIGEYIASHDSNMCIRDDYKYWGVDNNRHRTCGKPMILNDKIRQLFFDDNNCIITYEKDGSVTHNEFFNHINTIRVMLDDNYYVRIIEKFL